MCRQQKTSDFKLDYPTDHQYELERIRNHTLYPITLEVLYEMQHIITYSILLYFKDDNLMPNLIKCQETHLKLHILHRTTHISHG